MRSAAGLASVDQYFYLGHIYNYQQDYPRALAQFQRALELRPNYVDAEREIRLLEMRRQKGATLTTRLALAQAAYELRKINVAERIFEICQEVCR